MLASITKQAVVEVPVEDAWDALRDWGALHTRLAPGFVTDLHLDGSDRVITFFNGAVVRERLITLDEHGRRLVWSIVDGPYEHHNGAAQVRAEGEGATRLTWVADLLPDGLAERTEPLMQRGIETMKAALEAEQVAR